MDSYTPNYGTSNTGLLYTHDNGGHNGFGMVFLPDISHVT